jgi:hypothetical protein
MAILTSEERVALIWQIVLLFALVCVVRTIQGKRLWAFF